MMNICKYCKKEFNDPKRPKGSQCRSCEISKRRMRKKSYYVNIKGGKCSRCGYDKNIGALHFHHIQDKNYSLNSRELLLLNEDIIIKELENCILLCANCHAEEHCNFEKFNTGIQIWRENTEQEKVIHIEN